MEDSRILIDTSVIIDHLRKEKKEKSLLYNISDTNVMYISTITVFELFSGATNKKKSDELINLLKIFKTVPFNSEIARIAAREYNELKKINKILEIRDLFIVSTAKYLNIPICTLNKRHFQKIVNVILFEI